MRKKNRAELERELILNHKHFKRRLSSSHRKKYGTRVPNRRKAKSDFLKRDIVVFAPSIIDIYKIKHHRQFVEFKDSIESLARKARDTKQPLRICFRNTRAITAAACLLMIATVDSIIQQTPSIQFKATRPHRNPVKGVKAPINLVDAVLCQVGFYELIGMNVVSNHINNPSVKCWKFASSSSSDGEVAGEILKNIINNTTIVKGVLYRSCIEAISNAAEHAYSNDIKSIRTFPVKKWWIFVGTMSGDQTILICDLGHGIPNTLEMTQQSTLLQKIWSKIGAPNKSRHPDCDYIHASTLVKETRTGLSHRGKGTTDLRTFVDKTDNSRMLIFSNKGVYRYYNQHCKRLPTALENHSSIGGTVVEWCVPLACC